MMVISSFTETRSLIARVTPAWTTMEPLAGFHRRVREVG
jgi:hypothetical protein